MTTDLSMEYIQNFKLNTKKINKPNLFGWAKDVNHLN